MSPHRLTLPPKPALPQATLLAIIVSSLCVLPGARAADDPLTVEWDLRLRHEHVDDEAFADTADAATARLRLGLRGRFGEHWRALLEGEGLANAGDNYNSGTNGRTTAPAVIDPEAAELNQAWVAWTSPTVTATLGRQRLLFDNQRFDNQRWIGNVGWRQNEQTFDALSLEVHPTDAWTLRYAWLDKVHRVASDEARDPLARERALSTHLLSGAWTHGRQQWTGYAWLHDDRDVATASTATWGARWTGTLERAPLTWGWTLEYARQRDHADNPLSFSHAYWRVEPSLQASGVTWKLGHEHLGGDGRHALQTPLATLHAFNGWADKFLVTPARGLDDRYLAVSGQWRTLAWAAAWHDYRPDTSGGGVDRYGREWNLSLSRPLSKQWTGLLKAADYRADDFARDTRKLWVQLEWKGTHGF